MTRTVSIALRTVGLVGLVALNVLFAPEVSAQPSCKNCVMDNGWPACPVEANGKWQICIPSSGSECDVIAMGCSGAVEDEHAVVAEIRENRR